MYHESRINRLRRRRRHIVGGSLDLDRQAVKRRGGPITKTALESVHQEPGECVLIICCLFYDVLLFYIDYPTRDLNC